MPVNTPWLTAALSVRNKNVAPRASGPIKLSGIGTKAGGSDYLLEFLLTRTITENTLRRGFAPEPEETTSFSAEVPAVGS